MKVLFNKNHKKNYISFSNSFEIKKEPERAYSQKNIFGNKENLERKYFIPIKNKNSSTKKKSPVKTIIINNQLIFSQNKKNENLFPDIEKKQNETNIEKINCLRKLNKKKNTTIFKKDIFLKMRSGTSKNILNKSDSKINVHLIKYPLIEKHKYNNISNYISKSKNNTIEKENNFFYNPLLKTENNYNTIDNFTINKYNNNNKINNNIFFKKIIKESIIKQYSLYSKAGKNENNQRKINQDYYLIITKLNNNPNFNIFSVLDGHGKNGHLVSKHISKYLKKRFENEEKLKYINETEEIYNIIKENNFKLIKDYFIEAEKNLNKELFDCNFSGTTCVLLIQINYHIICANVGDSRAILINETKIKKKKDLILNLPNYNNLNNKILEIIQLSKDNKPNNPNEKNRIIKFGGKIEQFNINGIKKGPYRVWVKNKKYPGLAMSRSIGDLIATNIGVIPLPEIFEVNITEYSKFILICSDGVWEFLNNNFVVDICKKYYFNDNIEQMCFELIKISEEMWKKNELIVDDITVLSIFF